MPVILCVSECIVHTDCLVQVIHVCTIHSIIHEMSRRIHSLTHKMSVCVHTDCLVHVIHAYRVYCACFMCKENVFCESCCG